MNTNVRAGAVFLSAVLAVLAGYTVTASAVPVPPPSAGLPPAAGGDTAVLVELVGTQLRLRARDGLGAPAEPERLVLRVGARRGPAGELSTAGAENGPAGLTTGMMERTGPPGWVGEVEVPASPAAPAPQLSWDTTAVPADRLADPLLDWRLLTATGPGRVTALAPAVDVPGQRPRPTPSGSVAGGDPGRPLAGQRSAGSWAFDTPGSYRLTLAVRATLASGQPVSAQADYRVEVTEPATAPRPVPVPADPSPTSSPAPSLLPAPAPPARPAPLAPARTGGTGPAPAGSAPAGTAAARPTVLARGHVDAVAARMVNGALRLQVNDGSGGQPVWREPSSVVLHALPTSRITLPDNPKLAFLGRPGAPVWLLPQEQKTDLLWPGWSSEHAKAGQLTGDLTWQLVDAKGPGAFALFVTSGFGEPSLLFNSADGVGDTTALPPGTHAHGNWAFTAEGVYRLTFELSGTLPSGQRTSDRQTLTFAVGSVDPSTVEPPGPGGTLPRTGPSLLAVAALTGLGLVLAGVAALLLARSRPGGGRAASAGSPG